MIIFQDFKVHFVFGNNPYFDHEELTKLYKYDRDDNIVGVEFGPTEIVWKENSKNPTKVQKKKKKKGKKTTGGEITWENTESFFNAFNRGELNDEALFYEAKDEGEFLREDLIPNAMEYYLDIMGESDHYVYNFLRFIGK